MSYRQFELINSNNDTWYFTDHDFRVFLNEPTGLGFSRSFTTTRYGNVQVIDETTEEFPKPGGEIIFLDSLNEDRYEKYDNFVRFVSHEPLQFVYIAPGLGSFTLNCVITSLEKSESTIENIMRCAVEFQGLGFWKGNQIERNITDSTFTLENTGDFPCGFEITLTGSVTNPYFKLYQDNELYGEARFVGTFDGVYVDSNDGRQTVALSQNGDVVPNSIAYQDLTISNGSIYVTFMKIPRGNSSMEVGADSGSVTNTNIRYTPIYRSI